jgi:hypothetical protein
MTVVLGLDSIKRLDCGKENIDRSSNWNYQGIKNTMAKPMGCLPFGRNSQIIIFKEG